MTKKANSNPIEPIKANCGKVSVAHKTNPIFSQPNMPFQTKNREMEDKQKVKKTKRTQSQQLLNILFSEPSVFSEPAPAKAGGKNKNDKTNPIQNSLTYYTERTNPKIAQKKQTQSNPFVDNFRCPAGVILSVAKNPFFNRQSKIDNRQFCVSGTGPPVSVHGVWLPAGFSFPARSGCQCRSDEPFQEYDPPGPQIPAVV